MAKVKIHRIAIYIEERVDYYVQMKRVCKSDPVSRVDLLSFGSHQKDCLPILPVRHPGRVWKFYFLSHFIPSADVVNSDGPRTLVFPRRTSSPLMLGTRR